jgi:hypothetical protein
LASNSDMAILKTMLMTWNDDQINRAWHLISEEGKRRRVEKNKRLKQNLKPGDKVTWSGGKKQGKIIRTKYKKAIVSEAGVKHNWDIPFHMLTKVA